MADNSKKKVTISSVPIAKIFVGFIFFLAFLAAVVYGVTYLISSSIQKTSPDLSPQSSSELQETTVSAKHPLENFEFHRNGFSDLVPAEVDSYIESSDLNYLLGLLLTESWSESLNDQSGLEINEADLENFAPNYALMQVGGNYALILIMEDPSAASVLVEEVSPESAWQGYVVDNFLVITSSEDLITSIEEATTRQQLPLSLYSDFQSYVQALPQSGQFFIYTPLRDKRTELISLEKSLGLLPAEVEGRGFVILREGDASKLIYK